MYILAFNMLQLIILSKREDSFFNVDSLSVCFGTLSSFSLLAALKYHAIAENIYKFIKSILKVV